MFSNSMKEVWLILNHQQISPVLHPSPNIRLLPSLGLNHTESRILFSWWSSEVIALMLPVLKQSIMLQTAFAAQDWPLKISQYLWIQFQNNSSSTTQNYMKLLLFEDNFLQTIIIYLWKLFSECHSHSMVSEHSVCPMPIIMLVVPAISPCQWWLGYQSYLHQTIQKW